MIRAFPHRIIQSLLTKFRADSGGDRSENPSKSKGQGLLRLHEYQHRVIVEIFRVSISGISVFSLILFSFSFYNLLDPYAPTWMGYAMAALGFLLGFVLYRTVQEFKTYCSNYDEITTFLQSKLLKQPSRTVATGSAPKGLENKLLSSLKPKEHKGWDSKPCESCHKTLEMLTTVCQHCGHDQDNLLIN